MAKKNEVPKTAGAVGRALGDIAILVDAIATEANKALTGNKSAATRARVALSTLREVCTDARKALIPYIAKRG